MELRFTADEWEKLSPPERIKRCRLLAEEAEKLAASATPSLRAAYADLARQWLTLANEMTQEISRGHHQPPRS